jgi:hypothetical protein
VPSVILAALSCETLFLSLARPSSTLSPGYSRCLIHAARLANVHADPKLKRLSDSFKPVCRPFNDARNHLEHIDERLARNPTETGSLQGEFFVFAGVRFDISESGLRALTNVYEEVIRVITMVDSSGQPFTSDAYDRLEWKPTIRREAPGRRR